MVDLYLEQEEAVGMECARIFRHWIYDSVPKPEVDPELFPTLDPADTCAAPPSAFSWMEDGCPKHPARYTNPDEEHSVEALYMYNVPFGADLTQLRIVLRLHKLEDGHLATIFLRALQTRWATGNVHGSWTIRVPMICRYNRSGGSSRPSDNTFTRQQTSNCSWIAW
jgi:hypothetical protein